MLISGGCLARLLRALSHCVACDREFVVRGTAIAQLLVLVHLSIGDLASDGLLESVAAISRI